MYTLRTSNNLEPPVRNFCMLESCESYLLSPQSWIQPLRNRCPIIVPLGPVLLLFFFLQSHSFMFCLLLALNFLPHHQPVGVSCFLICAKSLNTVCESSILLDKPAPSSSLCSVGAFLVLPFRKEEI